MEQNESNKLLKDINQLKQSNYDLTIKLQRTEAQLSKMMETQKQVNEMKTYFDTKKRIEENETARLNRIQS